MSAYSPGPPQWEPDNRRTIRRLSLLIVIFGLLAVAPCAHMRSARRWKSSNP